MQKVEKSIDNKSIVILISDNLHLDANNKETIKTVSDNLERGVIYIFITSDSPKNVDNIQRCKQIHARQNGLSINMITDNVIRRRTLDNILIIIDPKNGVNSFLQLPVGTEEWWVKLDKEHTDQVVSNIHTYIRSDDIKTVYGFDPSEKFKATFSPITK